jgi:hypothetical protein
MPTTTRHFSSPGAPLPQSEAPRIGFLLARDGADATREWVDRTLGLYRAALASPASHASSPGYRRLFESAIRDFEAWLDCNQEKTWKATRRSTASR